MLRAASLGAVRLRWFLSMMAIVLAVAAITVVVDARLDGVGGDGDQVVSGAEGTAVPTTGQATTTSEPVVTVAPADQTTVTGTVTALHLDGAGIDPREVPTPLTVVSDRGFGNGGEIAGVTVDGTPASIVWDGGRPFLLSSGGALVLSPVRVDLTPVGLRLALADAVHAFAPGTYRLDTPVAVGTSGVAGAREAVTFDADADSTFELTGDAALFLGPTQARHLTGAGAVHLEGTLELVDADGTRAVSGLDLAVGSYDLTITPVADGGWTISAILRGETTAT